MQHSLAVAPRKYMRDICKARHKALGTAGNASSILVTDLVNMYRCYENGELGLAMN